MNYWLLKSEPSVFGIDDLERNTREHGEELWDGVRNYQARNYLREMKKGDLGLFYHSNCQVPGIYGQLKIVRERLTDPTQFDPESRYFDPKSNPEQPRWETVTVAFLEKWMEPVSLEQLRQQFPEQDYAHFSLVRRGNRLSVMPVTEQIYRQILALRQ